MEDVKLLSTRCAICDTENNDTELYPAKFDMQAFKTDVFSARRLPDRIHYRIIKCNTCGLIRSDTVVDPQILAQLYAKSTFNYDDEVANLRFTYGRYLFKLDNYGVQKGALLEIGCGNGFFLEEALAQGYATVRGVEPSADAIAKASSKVRPYIVCDIMHPGLFESEQFDVICMFQVFDHIPNPGYLLEECFRILKPGGMILCINHNVQSVSARLLKERSPIIDIEHTYLYSSSTMSNIFAAHRFKVVHVGSVYNKYTMHYLAWLAPLPAALKSMILTFIKSSYIGHIRVSVPLGNFHVIARRPF